MNKLLNGRKLQMIIPFSDQASILLTISSSSLLSNAAVKQRTLISDNEQTIERQETTNDYTIFRSYN